MVKNDSEWKQSVSITVNIINKIIGYLNECLKKIKIKYS